MKALMHDCVVECFADNYPCEECEECTWHDECKKIAEV